MSGCVLELAALAFLFLATLAFGVPGMLVGLLVAAAAFLYAEARRPPRGRVQNP